VCAGHGLGVMSIGVIVGKKIKILKHCVEYVCTLLLWLRWPVGRLLPAAKQLHPAGLRVTQIEARSGESRCYSKQAVVTMAKGNINGLLETHRNSKVTLLHFVRRLKSRNKHFSMDNAVFSHITVFFFSKFYCQHIDVNTNTNH